MSVEKAARTVLSSLKVVRDADRVLRRKLNEMVEAGDKGSDELRLISLEINELLIEMGDSRNVRLIKRSVDEARPDVETPTVFREAYEKLHLKSYQTASSPPMTSDRGMAVYGKKGRYASVRPAPGSSRAVIRDRRMWEYKRRVDRKLRKLAGEIELKLSGYSDDRTEQLKRCTGCKKLGEDDWAYCPRCGAEMEFDDVD